MCGIIAFAGEEAAKNVFSGLAYLQHRGQDATGIASMQNTQIFIEKGFGLSQDVFDDQRVTALLGDMAIGHVRYSTAGVGAHVSSEIQPFYVNQPYGMTLAHNGNLTNTQELRDWLVNEGRRHINSESDSELLLNVLAHLLEKKLRENVYSIDLLFDVVAEVYERCVGSYSVIVLIAGIGLLSFRDPHGIRPLSVGGKDGEQWLIASESAAFHPCAPHLQCRDILSGEAVFIDCQKVQHSRQICKKENLPCIFEYIYLARPDTTLNDVSVYKARSNMGRKLAEKIKTMHCDLEIDCVVPIPDSGRIAAMELAHELDISYREGLVKNRYVGRTFIAAGQEHRYHQVQRKLNVIKSEFYGRKVLLVDDSIVRGTTGRELVSLARGAGAVEVYFASAAPPVCFPNVYGLDIPTRMELLASNRNEEEIAAYLGADRVIYQSLADLIAAVQEENSSLVKFETSCFDGRYLVGNIDEEYLQRLEESRFLNTKNNLSQGDLKL